MTTRVVAPFPFAVCWDRTARSTVLNPIALDIPEPIFRATHHPSVVHRAGATTDAVVAVPESLVLDEFVSTSLTHVFTAAVGDTGTGKSHFVRWVYLELTRRRDPKRRVVMIPRSSANLTDVVRRILQNFSGEATDRLRAEVERHRGLSESEARHRVVDELALALENLASVDGDDDDTGYVRESLPALLRDNELRRAMIEREDGIVQRLARHILGQRESTEADVLRWEAADLVFPVKAIDRAGAIASELAGACLTDDRLRHCAALLLQRAQTHAVPALLRFRTGDLKRALNEIRAQLARGGEELVLLLEDLSITEGLDGELLEALQVRTQDSGEQLCPLRSLVGLTRDDYQRLRDNIRERLTRTLWFDSPIGEGTDNSEDAALAQFSGRYLNAVRLGDEQLARLDDHDVAIPNACDDCRNRADCHAAFGASSGYGLYPFTSVALGRLYRRVVRPDGAAKPFKPRAMLRVLSEALDEAEHGFERRDFPTAALAASFGLGRTTAELQIALRNELGSDGDRLLRAIELYAEQPGVRRPQIGNGIASALQLRLPDWSGDRARPAAVGGGALTPPPPPPPMVPSLDAYDEWLRGAMPSDKAVNLWRDGVYEAVTAAIEWDADGIAYLQGAFLRKAIEIEGQATRTAEPVLTVQRAPETAVALRVLCDASWRQDPDEAMIRVARRQIENWSREVRATIADRAAPAHAVDALSVSVRLLVVGAMLRGTLTKSSTDGQVLDQAMRAEWDVAALGRERGPAWSALVAAYAKHGAKVREVVHKALSCTKGSQAGAFLNPSPILRALNDVRRGALPTFSFEDGTRWGVFRDASVLAKEVAQHLPVALREELAAAKQWRDAVADCLGEDQPADVIAALKSSCEAAVAAGSPAGTTRLREAVDRLQGRAIKNSLDAAARAQDAPDDGGRLQVLGALDPTTMKEVRTAIELASAALSDIETKLCERIENTEAAAGYEDGMSAVHTSLDAVEAALSELLGEATTNG